MIDAPCCMHPDGVSKSDRCKRMCISLDRKRSVQKKCRKKCLKAEPSHQDPWNFAGDTGKNSFYGSVEKMKLGLATGEIWRISRDPVEMWKNLQIHGLIRSKDWETPWFRCLVVTGTWLDYDFPFSRENVFRGVGLNHQPAWFPMVSCFIEPTQLCPVPAAVIAFLLRPQLWPGVINHGDLTPNHQNCELNKTGYVKIAIENGHRNSGFSH